MESIARVEIVKLCNMFYINVKTRRIFTAEARRGGEILVGNKREMMRLGRRSTLSEMICNAACTALIESVSDACEGLIRDYARGHGLVTGYRYSPGYGDFPLTQQPEVLGLISADTRLGITLTDSMLMLPKKSVSALVGLYPESLGVKRGGTSCERCENREFCEFRKEGYGCGG